ncbi:tetratricopeptide repeat protein [Breznakiella homolactica]|uniref:Tetratricopeptide repeat protein n=1 Tax=Breznakiella homolactica TaxID=2798577 RepID=A0A7T7XPJ6_9SPIR|nr:tetratricopeptide repeat protein [Breznakiella homolactica]QQO10118.1 tetratricopeptide repeat protein [Breznakiella homolactica]
MYYILAILPYLIQLACVIHVFRTGRNTTWIWVIIFLPYIGGIAYLLAEILPDLRTRKSLHEISDIVVSTIMPSRKIDKLKSEAEFTPSFQNRKALADEYLASGYFEEAVRLYDALLTGHEKNNPSCLLMKAKALYGLKRYEEAAGTVKVLEETGFVYSRESEVLIKLKIAEHIQDKASADLLYEQFRKKFSSFEINYYYAEYLIEQGETGKAESIINEAAETRDHLRKSRIKFERKWADKTVALRRKIKK